MKLDESFLNSLEKVVGEMEAESSVEVVVAVAARSGSYRDVAYLWGMIVAWLSMGFLVLVPLEISDIFLLPVTALGFFVGFAVGRSPLAWKLVPEARKRKQVEEASCSVFFREHVSATQDRSGLLVYLSMDEMDLAIVPDYGVEAKVPTAVWNNLRARVQALPPAQRWDGLLPALREVAPQLAKALPRKSDDRDELPNRPRIVA